VKEKRMNLNHTDGNQGTGTVTRKKDIEMKVVEVRKGDMSIKDEVMKMITGEGGKTAVKV